MTISCEAVPVPVVVASQSVENCSDEGITSVSLAVHEYSMKSNMFITVIGPRHHQQRAQMHVSRHLYNSSRDSII
jgi:hypothetical protein